MQILWQAAFGAALVAAPAGAQECPWGSPEPVQVTEWRSTEPTSQGVAFIYFSYRNETDKAIRMLDASVRFYDALGKEIGARLLDRDGHLAPRETLKGSIVFGPAIGPYFERLLVLDPADVRVFICTTGIVFGDGAVEKY